MNDNPCESPRAFATRIGLGYDDGGDLLTWDGLLDLAVDEYRRKSEQRWSRLRPTLVLRVPESRRPYMPFTESDR